MLLIEIAQATSGLVSNRRHRVETESARAASMTFTTEEAEGTEDWREEDRQNGKPRWLQWNYRSRYCIVRGDSGCSGSASSASTFCRRAGREIPSFFILEIKGVRFTPSLDAAPVGPPITQPTASSSRRTGARPDSLHAPFEGNTVTRSIPLRGSA